MQVMNPRRSAVFAVLAIAVPVVAAGCSSGTSSILSGADPSFVTITPASEPGGVRPDSVVRVRASEGVVQSVHVLAESGTELVGGFSGDHRAWTSGTPLQTNRTYDIPVLAGDVKKRAVTISTMFWTLKPKTRLAAAVAPLSGETV